MKILLIGPVPPPLGGISVFIKRYSRQLQKEGHEVDILDISRLTRFRCYLWLLTAPLGLYSGIHVHSFSFGLLMMLLLRGAAGKTQLVDHGERDRLGCLKTGLLRLFLSRCQTLSLDGSQLRQYYIDRGIVLPADTRVQHPFLPPPLEEEAGILQSYPPDVNRFVDQRHPLIIANAYRLAIYDGVDLYGLDMCVELVDGLNKTHPRLGLLFVLAEEDETRKEYFLEMNRRIDILGLKKYFHFMTGQKELWPLFKKAQLMVRPTFRDGFGISVAEALYFNCPAVASDAAERAKGTILFANRDGKDFLAKCAGVLRHLENPREPEQSQ